MGPRWMTALAGLLAIAAMASAAAVPTEETLVVSRSEEESTTAAPVEVSTESTTKAAATTEEPSPPIKLTEMYVHSEVTMRYAHTAVVTRVRNPAKRAQEATFRVLLPETAFISGFTMTLEGKSYKAYVKEKEEAKQIYSAAVSQGLGAAHISTKARDSNHFTVSVNVEPETSAVFNLTYEELLVRRNNVYNHAVNLHPGALVPNLTVIVHIKEAQKITELRVPEVRTGNEIDATEDDAQNSEAVIVRENHYREATIIFTPDLEQQRKLMEVYAQKTKESQSHSSRWYAPQEEKETPDGVLGQFVVQYDVERPKDGEILVNDGYFVHFFAPTSLPPLNKHVVFVLDTSGSMMDRKIVQLREAMQTILGELNRGDYFSIVEFASSVKVYDLKEADNEPEPRKPYYYYSAEYDKPTELVPPFPATPENIARAKVIVTRLDASGGTNIASALNVAVDLIHKGVGWKVANTTAAPTDSKATTPGSETAKADEQVAKSSEETPKNEEVAKPSEEAPKNEEVAKPSEEAPKNEEVAKPEYKDKKDEPIKLEPIIIFLTDGDPTVGESNPTVIINRLSEKNYGENKASIFSLAFGEDADRKFLRKLSLRNEGFMRHIYEAADAALQLRDFYRQVSSPLLADVHFVYPKEQIKEGSLTKNKFRTIYAGSETVVAGRVADAGVELSPHVYGVCGVDDSFIRKQYEITPRVPVARSTSEYLPLERLWAYLTIKQLLDERDAADDAAKVDKEDENSPEKKALTIALKYEFVTPLTSLVVVKPNATNAVDAESVDKLSGPPAYGVGVPLVNNFGLSGASQSFNAAPQFAYSQVQSLVPHPIVESLALEESDVDYDTLGDRIGGPAGAVSPAVVQSLIIGGLPPQYSQYMPARPSPALSGLPGGAQVQLDPVQDYPVPVYDSAPSTPVASRPTTTPSPTIRLEPYHLQGFGWVLDALVPGSDTIALSQNSTVGPLELTKDAVAPKEPSGDAECPSATDGAAGVCVYLTRCDAARDITLAQYTTTYCRVNNKYAGVCCPRAKVDLVATH